MTEPDTAVLDTETPSRTPHVYVPPTQQQYDLLRRTLVEDGDTRRAALLLAGASFPATDPPGMHGRDDRRAVAAIRALRRPAHEALPAALLRIARAIDSETERLYHRKDAGHHDATPALSAIAFLLFELGFTVGGEAGHDCAEVEAAVARVYDLPDHPGTATHPTSPGEGA